MCIISLVFPHLSPHSIYYYIYHPYGPHIPTELQILSSKRLSKRKYVYDLPTFAISHKNLCFHQQSHTLHLVEDIPMPSSLVAFKSVCARTYSQDLTKGQWTHSNKQVPYRKGSAKNAGRQLDNTLNFNFPLCFNSPT